MNTPFYYLSVAPYGGHLRNISVALFTEDDTSVHQHLTPEEAEEMARMLLNAAHAARQEEVVPDIMSMRPSEPARIREKEEVAA
jgi:hypothetical protein